MMKGRNFQERKVEHPKKKSGTGGTFQKGKWDKWDILKER
jgi:hypothetical protein